MNRSRIFGIFNLLCVTMLLVSGCAAVNVARNFIQPPPVPSFHQPDSVPMRRVAVLPIYFDDQQQVNPGDLDLVFHAELTKTSSFEVVPISRAELSGHYGIQQLSSVQVIPRDLLQRLTEDYAVDGVLFTDLTHYFPYYPISIGVRCKLIDVRSGTAHWVFDHIFDSANPGVAVAAKQFCVDQEFEQLPITSDGTSILQSPSEFGKYVAHEAYRSLIGI